MPNQTPIVTTVKVNPSFIPKNEDYPHFRLIPIVTDTGKYHCLYLFLDPQNHMILEARAKRHAVIKWLELLTEHAPLTVFEDISR